MKPMIRMDPLVPPFQLVHQASKCGGRFVWIEANIVICDRCDEVVPLQTPEGTTCYTHFDVKYSPISFSTS